MHSYEEAPPPYPGTAPSAPPNIVVAKGDYRGVPVYEVGPSIAPSFNQMNYQTYQQAPVTLNDVNVVQTHVARFGRVPVHCVCPQCHQQIVTRIQNESGVFTWLICLLLLIIGCIPCCLIPFCVSSCQDNTHRCPNCSAIIARHKVV